MATLFNNTIVFVDPSSGVNGVGDTAATAKNVLPTIATFATNTTYLIRRTNTNISLATGTMPAAGNNIAIIGMPKKEDDLYQFIDPATQDLWGNDEPEYAPITSTATTAVTSFIFTANNAANLKLAA